MKTKRIYLPTLKGLAKKKHKGHNTRNGAPRTHVYKVDIYGQVYFKVQLHRGLLNVSKYFKLKRDAKEFVIQLMKDGVWEREL